MSFTLSLGTPTQSNDAKTIAITDTSTTWGTTYNYPDGITTAFSLDITVQVYAGSTAFDTITDSAFFNAYDSGNKTFDITADLLKVGGVAQYDSTDMLPDGVWTLTYKLLQGATVLTSYQVSIVVLGQIIIDGNKAFVYSPNQWHQAEIQVTSANTMKLLEALRKYSLRKAIYSEPYQSNISKILNAIELLTRMITPE